MLKITNDFPNEKSIEKLSSELINEFDIKSNVHSHLTFHLYSVAVGCGHPHRGSFNRYTKAAAHSPMMCVQQHGG